MAGTLTNIVMVQYFPGTDEYMVYREGEEAELHRGGSSVTDQDFYIYAQECAATGCVCESSFHVATGRTEGARTLTCKQLMYSKALAKGASARAVVSGARGVAAGAVNAVVNVVGGTRAKERDSHISQSNIQWVKWNPAVYELQICAGKLPIPKTHRINNLQDADDEVLDFMVGCFDDGLIAMSRSYQRPVQGKGGSHMAFVSEYYFAVSKMHKDFTGRDAKKLTEEDLVNLGLVE